MTPITPSNPGTGDDAAEDVVHPLTADRARELLSAPTVDLRTAADLLGYPHSTAYDMARLGTFPAPVIVASVHRRRNRYRVPSAPLRALLALDA